MGDLCADANIAEGPHVCLGEALRLIITDCQEGFGEMEGDAGCASRRIGVIVSILDEFEEEMTRLAVELAREVRQTARKAAFETLECEWRLIDYSLLAHAWKTKLA